MGLLCLIWNGRTFRLGSRGPKNILSEDDAAAALCNNYPLAGAHLLILRYIRVNVSVGWSPRWLLPGG